MALPYCVSLYESIDVCMYVYDQSTYTGKGDAYSSDIKEDVRVLSDFQSHVQQCVVTIFNFGSFFLLQLFSDLWVRFVLVYDVGYLGFCR